MRNPYLSYKQRNQLRRLETLELSQGELESETKKVFSGTSSLKPLSLPEFLGFVPRPVTVPKRDSQSIQKRLLQMFYKHKRGFTVKELSDRLELSRNQIVRHVHLLEAKGLLYFRYDHKTRRYFHRQYKKRRHNP